jgi:UDP-N-acetylglucosamine diphosphorylase / glucose-1-phosphate thymidylyltransferase / UDP-N-acetylgalactosamine diphosphorylase / glucosamine-1-phosphate N-acetyltransferase / galactosamine-1-phosphate N-acetyltransferase
MATPSLVLFDDARAQAWEPFALTRPVGELLFGALTFRARAERVLGLRCTLQLGAEHLLGFEEEGTPRFATFDDAPTGGPRLFLSSRAVPAWGATVDWESLPDAAGVVYVDDEVAGWWAPAGAEAPSPEWLVEPRAERQTVAARMPGRLLANVWDIIGANPRQITEDINALFADASAPTLPDGVFHFGEHPVVLGENAHVEPGVVLDTTGGPIYLADDAVVRAFTRLAGPAYVGPGSTVLGGAVEAVSIGPVCKVRGELAESVCLGYVNKAHDGHMGHAYLGRWVNLGAETTNSDLKNNYGTIRLWTPTGEVDTGEIKMGCLLGDHVKTGIGLLLNTGTVVGAGSNLFGAAMPPKHVPPFSWGSGEELVEFRLDKFLEVAERAMERRKVTLTDGARAQLGTAWKRGRGEGRSE